MKRAGSGPAAFYRSSGSTLGASRSYVFGGTDSRDGGSSKDASQQEGAAAAGAEGEAAAAAAGAGAGEPRLA
jgi:hypothetical protein